MWTTLIYINQKDNEEIYFDDYLISDKGEIKHKKNNIIRKHLKNKTGYHYIKVRKNGQSKKIFINRALLSSFKREEYFDGAYAGFVDENIEHLTVTNLQWFNDVELCCKGTRLERIKQTKEKKKHLANMH